jgi:two-component system, OmpR family, alkaline phosphatase synthesis response regulator PhoP
MNDSRGIKLLIVDDEPDIVEFLSYNLKKEGFTLFSATNGRDCLKIAQKIVPQLILLDIMMPDMDGIETCEKLRENPLHANTLIVFLTARSEDYSQIAGFQAGGDDFINKPIKPKLLITRLNAILKRFGQRNIVTNYSSSRVLKLNNITIDAERYLVIKNDIEMMLPRKEFQLLQLLTSKPSRVFTRDEIFEHIWGDEVIVGDRTIDVYIRKLRERLGDKHIQTIKGVGYKFES